MACVLLADVARLLPCACCRAALSRFPLSGPTLFAPVIRSAAAWAAQPSPVPKYYCLLIMTDGCIMDMDETIAAVVSGAGGGAGSAACWVPCQCL